METKIEKIDASSALAIKIIGKEKIEDLSFLSFREKLAMANISHEEKKQEWITARLAIYEALGALEVTYPGFFKDAHGKSQSMNDKGYVSLSHTEGFAAAIYHELFPVGIDLELIRDKILRIGQRFLAREELDFLNLEPKHYTMAWSAKESIFKCQGKRGVSFRENIFLEPFSIQDKVIFGKIRGANYSDHRYEIHVEQIQQTILTYTVW